MQQNFAGNEINWNEASSKYTNIHTWVYREIYEGLGVIFTLSLAW